jgi:hypothetical protein
MIEKVALKKNVIIMGLNENQKWTQDLRWLEKRAS